ncbi:efflux RND transporter periplasmic adaptor subunit [Pseudochelatococcus sp. B33]
MLSPAGPRQDPDLEGDDRTATSGRKRPWLVRFVWLVVLAAAVAAVVLYGRPDPSTQTGPGRFGRGGPPGGVPVEAAAVARHDMPVTLQALGTVTPLATVTARTRVTGQLTRVVFSEGQHVEKDSLLAEVDPRPYQLALEQAKSQLARDQAELTNAQIDLERYRSLVRQNAIARQQLDTQTATVRQLEATVRASAAAVSTAELNLEYTRTTAPISGRAGLRLVDEGNYAQAGDANGLVTITQMKPISVLFSVPEDQLPPINRRLAAGQTLPVTLYDRNRVHKLAEGRLATIDNQIDMSTGTIRLRAIFDNDDESLFPNQFVNVELLVDTIEDAVTIPASARLTGAPGTYAWLVDPESKTVSIRPITTGYATSDTVTVVDGLAPGDLVVTDGSDRLRDGMQVALPGDRPVVSETTPPQGDQQRPRRAPQGNAPGNGPSGQRPPPGVAP